jgi:hypothetical protein
MNSPRPNEPDYPPLAELVNAVGSDELRFHIRDEEAAVAGLPSTPLTSLAGLEATRVELAIYPVALRLPGLGTAKTMEVPDDGRWQGWSWAAHEFILIHAYRNPDLPHLALVTVPRPGLWRLDILGRPMCVWRAASGDAGWAANAYAAEVRGFFDDATEFWAQAVAPTVVRREQLLAAIATVERVASDG